MELKFLKAESLRDIVDNSKWERWYAWRPVWLEDGRCVFLQFVERKYVIDAGWDGPYLGRAYRKI